VGRCHVRPPGRGRGEVAVCRALAQARQAVRFLLAHFPHSGRCGEGAAVREVDAGARGRAIAVGSRVSNDRGAEAAGPEGVGEGGVGRRAVEGWHRESVGGVGNPVDVIEFGEGAR